MSTPRENLPKQPSRRTVIAAMFLGLAVAVFTVVAEQPDASTPSAPAEEVARELLEIQNRLGGSIVPALSLERPQSPADSRRRQSVTSESCVDHLRDTAWRLDSSAHRLECHNLYRQADALRELASQLRQDARNMNREAKKWNNQPRSPSSVD